MAECIMLGKITPIKDVLTSTSKINALSANMGKELNEKKANADLSNVTASVLKTAVESAGVAGGAVWG